jgi:hypothetical protein
MLFAARSTLKTVNFETVDAYKGAPVIERLKRGEITADPASINQ